MRKSLWICSAVLATMLAGCAHEYRVYDPYAHSYRAWDAHDRDYYNQWAHENHHENQDYKHLNKDQQNQYWAWRHQQEGH